MTAARFALLRDISDINNAIIDIVSIINAMVMSQSQALRAAMQALGGLIGPGRWRRALPRRYSM
jgi:hypothetical protein